jgi:hypothetical protein
MSAMPIVIVQASLSLTAPIRHAQISLIRAPVIAKHLPITTIGAAAFRIAAKLQPLHKHTKLSKIAKAKIKMQP